MALVKYNNNSISDITTPGSLAQGKMILISEQTASGSASISFTSGIDSTYPIYKFEFINIHPATDAAEFQFNMSIDSGSNYNVTKTTTWFNALHLEDDSDANLEYNASFDLAQSTAFQSITRDSGNGSDENSSGELFIYSPSSTTFVKHFMSTTNDYVHFNDGGSREVFCAGYGNTTSAVDAIRFQMSSGNIDAGTIKMYGIKGD
jgi:hypothetical protein